MRPPTSVEKKHLELLYKLVKRWVRKIEENGAKDGVWGQRWGKRDMGGAWYRQVVETNRAVSIIELHGFH